MVASRQEEIPYYRGVGRQRGRGLGALAQVFGRTAIPYLREYVVPGADMLEFAAPEIGEVISGRKSIESFAKSVGKQTLRKQLGEGNRWRKRAEGGRELAYGRQGGSKQKRIFPTITTKQSSWWRRDIFTNISH